MARRELTFHEFVNVVGGAYPTLKFNVDQWGEHGYFYDPLNRQFGYYSVDRKNQCDEVDTVATAEELLAQHCGAEGRPALQAWLDSFRVGLFQHQTLIWYPERKQLARFPVIASPLVVTGEREALASLDDSYAVRWLDEQIGRRDCAACEAYFGDWRSHGPSFPEAAFEIVEKNEFEVGTHAAVTVMEGVARCRACGQLADFGCDYGPGYWMSPKKPAKR